MPIPTRDSTLRGALDERSRPGDLRLGAMPEANVDESASTDRRPIRRMTSGSLVVLLLAVVAVVGLYSMRNIGRISASTGISREIEQLVASVLPPKGAEGAAAAPSLPVVDDSALFAMLDTDHRATLQLPFERLGRDPFELWRDPSAPAADPSAVEVEDRSGSGAAWGREVERVVGLLQLKSVIGGGSSSAMANVNGRIIRPGDVFTVAEAEAEFRVVRIERDSVVLKARNPRLGIEQDAVLRQPRPF